MNKLQILRREQYSTWKRYIKASDDASDLAEASFVAAAKAHTAFKAARAAVVAYKAAKIAYRQAYREAKGREGER